MTDVRNRNQLPSTVLLWILAALVVVFSAIMAKKGSEEPMTTDDAEEAP